MSTQPMLALRVVDGSHEPQKLVARSQLLKYITHPNLAQYIDVVRGRASRLGVVCEHSELHLAEFLQRRHCAGLPQEHVWVCAAQLLSAVATIHEQGLVHHRLSSSSVLVCHGGSDPAATSASSDAPTLKLANWGLHYLTAGGTLAPCPAADPRYMSPEVVVAGPGRRAAAMSIHVTGPRHTQSVNTSDGAGADIWALGMLLVEMILGSLPAPLCGSGSTVDMLQGVLGIARARAQNRAQLPGRVGSQIIAESDDPPDPAKVWPGTVSAQYRTIEAALRRLIDQCLEPQSAHRLDARSLLRGHEQLARHLKTSNISKGETNRGYPGLCFIPTVPAPPAVPTQGAGTMQIAAQVMSAPESAALTRVACVRRLRELLFEWLAQHAGDTDAVDKLIENAIAVKQRCESAATSATLRPRRSAAAVGLPMRLDSFPIITLRDCLYSVAVPVGERDVAEDFKQLDHGRAENLLGNDSATFPLPFVLAKPSKDDGESLTSDGADHSPPRHAASTSMQAESALEFHTTTSKEPHKLSVIPSYHPLWDGCSPQERQQLRVAVVANAGFPVPLRERHRAYQEARVAKFRALLEKMPSARNEIIRESKIDIPPALRAEIWPILLGLSAESLDSESMLTPIGLNVLDRSSVLDEKTRKQIDVDLPRCHQENAILASTEGQACLRFVLEAWLETHLQSSDYCQGLDSLAAPFVTLFFHRCCVNTDLSKTAGDLVLCPDDVCEPQVDEAAVQECPENNRGATCMRLAVQPAYCCLVAFTGRFLDQIFASGSTSMLRAQLAEFSELLSAELPQLASHFRDEGVTVELFAIPWLLTLFAHVLPLPNVLQLWDVLLTHGDDPRAESLPLYVAISVLRQSEAHLVTLDFNGTLLYLSRLPPIDLDCALRDAVAKWTAGSTADAS